MGGGWSERKTMSGNDAVLGGEVAIITGGIGSATVAALAETGASVVAAGVARQPITKMAALTFSDWGVRRICPSYSTWRCRASASAWSSVTREGGITAADLAARAGRSAAVVGLPDEEWGQRIVAAVVPGADPASPEQRREHVRAALRGSKTPDTVVFVEQLPYTDLGKLSRRAVAQLVREAN